MSYSTNIAKETRDGRVIVAIARSAAFHCERSDYFSIIFTIESSDTVASTVCHII